MKLFRLENPRLRRAAMLALALVAIILIVHEIFGENGYLALRRKRQELQAKLGMTPVRQPKEVILLILCLEVFIVLIPMVASRTTLLCFLQPPVMSTLK